EAGRQHLDDGCSAFLSQIVRWRVRVHRAGHLHLPRTSIDAAEAQPGLASLPTCQQRTVYAGFERLGRRCANKSAYFCSSAQDWRAIDRQNDVAKVDAGLWIEYRRYDRLILDHPDGERRQ